MSDNDVNADKLQQFWKPHEHPELVDRNLVPFFVGDDENIDLIPEINKNPKSKTRSRSGGHNYSNHDNNVHPRQSPIPSTPLQNNTDTSIISILKSIDNLIQPVILLKPKNKEQEEMISQYNLLVEQIRNHLRQLDSLQTLITNSITTSNPSTPNPSPNPIKSLFFDVPKSEQAIDPCSLPLPTFLEYLKP